MTAKKCTKKRDARAKIVLLIKPIVFLKFSLLSPSSDLKVPFLKRGGVAVTWLAISGFRFKSLYYEMFRYKTLEPERASQALQNSRGRH